MLSSWLRPLKYIMSRLKDFKIFAVVFYFPLQGFLAASMLERQGTNVYVCSTYNTNNTTPLESDAEALMFGGLAAKKVMVSLQPLTFPPRPAQPVAALLPAVCRRCLCDLVASVGAKSVFLSATSAALAAQMCAVWSQTPPPSNL